MIKIGFACESIDFYSNWYIKQYCYFPGISFKNLNLFCIEILISNTFYLKVKAGVAA